uniref:Uncharacterized protein n=1 Tax=Dunaliella tertiolecta TaxID=3047 RepID=A0A7S3R379_DUNTE
MTKKGGSAKKGQALSLHDFITNTPGALPLSACLPSRHGEVSKIESLAPKFGELSFGRDHPPPYGASFEHHHPYAPRYSSPYSNPYRDSYPFEYGAPSRADLHGYGYTYVPPPPPPPPRRQPLPTHEGSYGSNSGVAIDSMAGSGHVNSTYGSPSASRFNNSLHSTEVNSNGVHAQGFEVGSPGGSLVPGAVRLLRRQEGQTHAAGEVMQQQQQRAHAEQRHQQQECEEKQLQQRAREVEEELLASHEERAAAAEAAETAALAAAAAAKAEAAAATAAVTEVPLLVPLPQQAAQQAARQEAAAVKNEYAERMAAQALARMAARSALHSSSLTTTTAATPHAATASTSSSAGGKTGEHASQAQPLSSSGGGGVEPLLPGARAKEAEEEGPHSVRLQRALEDRQQQQQQPQPSAQPQPQPQPPAQRPRLHLLPRSKPLDVAEPPPASASSIFGGARPRDEKLHPTTGSGSVGSGPTTATSLANVQLHSLSASFCGWDCLCYALGKVIHSL